MEGPSTRTREKLLNAERSSQLTFSKEMGPQSYKFKELNSKHAHELGSKAFPSASWEEAGWLIP